MPELGDGQWLNSDGPLSKEQLRGHVVLLDFWDYTCANCIRTLPYLREWHKRYARMGLTIIGVHAPEFKFAANEAEVARAIQEFDLPYPVLLDTDFETWTRFANRAWPTKYLIDANGYIRLKRQGEGYYAEIEQAIQTLLRQRDPDISLPPILPPLRAEDQAGAVCYRPTPELYAGYQGGGLFGGALGNPEGYVTDGIMMYKLPKAAERGEGQFFVEGFWRAWPESLAFAGRGKGRVFLLYDAVGVNAVLSPSGDNVELMLNIRPSRQEPLIEVRQDGDSLTETNAGRDILFDENGRTLLRISRPRLYEIVRNPAFEKHELELIFHARGLAIFSFTFNTCVARHAHAGRSDVFVRR